jgi:hypothetical protein
VPAGLSLADSYHCSRYNTNTGRLTTAMFESVFEAVRTKLETSSLREARGGVRDSGRRGHESCS